MATSITLSGDITYGGEIDNFLAAKVIAFVEQESLNGALSKPQTRSSSNEVEVYPLVEGTNSQNKLFSNIGLNEAFIRVSATSIPSKIAVAGMRSMEENGKDTFTIRDVSEQFKSAGVSPKNLARDLGKAISQNLIYSVTGSKGEYKLTEISKKAFESGFNQIKIRTRSATASKSRKGGVVTRIDVSDRVKGMEAAVTLDGYPDYHSIEKKGDRILWILTYAAKNSVDSLNSKEVEYFARRISDNINSSALSALTVNSVKKGLLARTDSEYRLLHKGDVYLKGLTSGQE